MSAVNQCWGTDGELWQPGFFGRTLCHVKECNQGEWRRNALEARQAPNYSVSCTAAVGADFVRRTSCTISRRPGARTPSA